MLGELFRFSTAPGRTPYSTHTDQSSAAHFKGSKPTKGSIPARSPPGSIPATSPPDIARHTQATRDHLTPEIELRLITRECPLWHETTDQCPFTDPFWAFYWPGGQALTRWGWERLQCRKRRGKKDYLLSLSAAITCASYSKRNIQGDRKREWEREGCSGSHAHISIISYTWRRGFNVLKFKTNTKDTGEKRRRRSRRRSKKGGGEKDKKEGKRGRTRSRKA